MAENLSKKVERAIKLLQSIPQHNDEPIEIAYSGGKDSDVILELARMAKINFKAIYKCTTIDPPGTIKHCMENSVQIVRPQQTFFQLVAKNGMPNRFMRFCCRVLKEYPILYNSVIGVRKCESRARNARYSEPVVCRVYNKRKNLRVQQILPILDWSDEEELEFINARNIKLHPLYYREDGSVDISQRLGCMCCPLKSLKKRLDDFKKHPRMLRLYVRSAAEFLRTHPNSSVHKWAQPAHEYVFAEIMYAKHSYFIEKYKNGATQYGELYYKQALEEYFNVDLSI